MPCESCKYFDENDTYGYGGKGYCKYLEAYVYADDSTCSHYVRRGSAGGCYLTTACCDYHHLPDDCRELTAMRRLRDDYLRLSEDGHRLIADYYRTAPSIVRRIDASPARSELYDYIFEVVSNCTESIEGGNYEEAKVAYLEMVERLKEVLPLVA